jgi:hypothetical protein
MSEGKGKEPRPRLCQIIKWEDFDGYGFNLHAEKGKPGQFVGKVDEGSPAEAGGLREGDRILEVNGINITEESHKEVVQRIKASPNEALLLVVDSATDTYFKSNNVVLDSSHPSVLRLYTPPRVSSFFLYVYTDLPLVGHFYGPTACPPMNRPIFFLDNCCVECYFFLYCYRVS